MKVVALAGGVGAGKFLRGLVRAVSPADVTAVVNTGDDLDVHGLRVCPDLDSVTYWLGDAFDRERGWGRRDETFRATEELRAFDPGAAWFGLGDLDLATHLFRTRSLAEGLGLSEVTARIAARFDIGSTILPMSEQPVETRLDVVSAGRRWTSISRSTGSSAALGTTSRPSASKERTWRHRRPGCEPRSSGRTPS